MYNLFKRVPHTLDEIGFCVVNYIQRSGLDLINTQANNRQTNSTAAAVQFVNAILVLQNKFSTFLSSCWGDDKNFYKCIQRGYV